MNSDKETGASGQGQAGEAKESEVDEWAPLSVREARQTQKRRKDLLPYVWMNFASMVLLFAAAVIMAYRMGAQSCH